MSDTLASHGGPQKRDGYSGSGYLRDHEPAWEPFLSPITFQLSTAENSRLTLNRQGMTFCLSTPPGRLSSQSC